MTEIDAQLHDATRSVPLRALRSVAVRLPDGAPTTLPFAAVANYPPDFQAAGIGGIVSPQVLSGPDRAAAVDLRVPEVVFDARVTRIVATSGPVEGLERRPGGTGTGLAGEPQPYSVVADLVLGFAGHQVRVNTRVVATTRECGGDGALGLDALRRCALVLSSRCGCPV